MAFDPLTIPGCKLWLKDAGLYSAASGGSPVTADGAAVARWEDQSGNGNHRVQATTADQPVLKTSILNGLPVVRFAGLGGVNGDYLGGALGSNITGTVLSIFVVGVRRAIVANASVVTGLDSAAANDYANVAQVIPFFENNGELIQTYRATDLSTLPTHPGNNVPMVLGTIFNASTNTLYLNGTARPSVASTGSFNFNTFTVGCRREASVYTWRVNGDFAEVLVYAAALSSANRESVEGYLAWKWGQQSALSSGHPYKSFPPGLAVGHLMSKLAACGIDGVGNTGQLMAKLAAYGRAA